MTIFLVFFLVALAVMLIIFSSEALTSTYGAIRAVWFIGVATFLIIGMYLVGQAVIGSTPYTGKSEVVAKEEVAAHRSGGGFIKGVQSSRYRPKCYSVTVTPDISNPDPKEPSEWITSACIPMTQWVDVKVGDMVDLGYDKDRHPNWGSYLVQENQPIKGDKSEERQLCEVVDDSMKCDTVTEGVSDKVSSEQAIKRINEEGFREEMLEFREKNYGNQEENK